jgi:hypothetical protein
MDWKKTLRGKPMKCSFIIEKKYKSTENIKHQHPSLLAPHELSFTLHSFLNSHMQKEMHNEFSCLWNLCPALFFLSPTHVKQIKD